MSRITVAQVRKMSDYLNGLSGGPLEMKYDNTAYLVKCVREYSGEFTVGQNYIGFGLTDSVFAVNDDGEISALFEDEFEVIREISMDDIVGEDE